MANSKNTRLQSDCKFPSRRCFPPAGFTLIELLVVVSIIGLLLAMLLPAVQSVRAAARRTSCSNNIRQCGLAILSYEGSLGQFPPSDQSRLPATWNTTLSDPHHSWSSLILPYLEQRAVHDLIDYWQPAMSQANQHVGEKIIPVYRCPSYSGQDHSQADSYLDLTSADGSTGNTKYAIGNYVAMGATDTSALWRPQYSTGELGIVHPAAATRHQNVVDGLSNTFLLVESREENMRVWIDGRTAAYTSLPDPNELGLPSLNYTPYFRDDPTAEYGPSSLHPGGANHLFADASVRFVTAEVGVEMYNAQTTFAGHELPNE